MVQSSYSTLISKIKIPIEKDAHLVDGKSFGCIHPGKVSLPSYVKSTSHYNTFNFKQGATNIILCRTNILGKSNYKDYQSYFSESSFQKTLRNLIICGEYNKTKKRSTPMYCYGNTITYKIGRAHV